MNASRRTEKPDNSQFRKPPQKLDESLPIEHSLPYDGRNIHSGIHYVAPKPHSDTHAAIPHGQFIAAFITLVDDLANI